MIKNASLYNEFERQYIKDKPADLKGNLSIFNILKEQAILMNRWDTSSIDNLQWKATFARALNGRK